MFKIVGKQKKLIFATIIIITVLLVSIFGYFEFLLKSSVGAQPKESMDDRISPFENQALFFNINRVRRKGLEDIMRQPGFGTPQPQPYYLEINIDGKEYNYKEIDAPQGSGSGAITTWDTGYGYSTLIRDVEEEQETTEVLLRIMELQTKGILFSQEISVELETIHLIYEYRTGRWKGDDFFNDSDGYGHYLGENCEIWFEIQQSDYDFDGIPFWTEVNVLHTDPLTDDSKLDYDMDGIPTTWEWKWGYNPLVKDNHSILDSDNDGLSNMNEYQLEKWLSNPFYQDVFIEVDVMQGSGKPFELDEYVLPEVSQQMVIDKFAQHHITLHIDDGWSDGPLNRGGEILPFVEGISPLSGLLQKFYKYNFADERKGIFHYFVISHAAGLTMPQDYTNRLDASSLSASRQGYRYAFRLLPQGWFNPRMFYIWIGSIFMHELGHQLGLLPEFAKEWISDDFRDNATGSYIGGIDNQSHVFAGEGTLLELLGERNKAIEHWRDYISCMNYGNDGRGPLKGLFKPSYAYIALDYSNGLNGEHDFNDWDAIDLTFFKKQFPGILEGD